MEWNDGNYREHPALNVYGSLVENKDGTITVRKSFIRWKFSVRKDEAFAALVKDANAKHRAGSPYSYRGFVGLCWDSIVVERARPHISALTGAGKSGKLSLKQYKSLDVAWDENVQRANRYFLLGVNGKDDEQLYTTEKMAAGPKFSGHRWWDFPEQVGYALISKSVLGGLKTFLDAIKNEKIKARDEGDSSIPSDPALLKLLTIKSMFGFEGKKTITVEAAPPKSAIEVASELGLDLGLV